VRRTFGIPELDRLVKFVYELNELGKKHQVGLGSQEEIYLVLDGKETPFLLDTFDTNDLSVVVSV